MSLQIIKAGIFDTIQDCGRYGYQHLGINPGGAMDIYSAQLCNALLGKELNAPVIEMHFPSSKILFEKEAVICITGADFLPVINQQKVPVGQPIVVNRGGNLQFEKVNFGARSYLSVMQNMEADKWLNSYSTNLKAEAGGFRGRALKKADILNFKNNIDCKNLLAGKDVVLLPWGLQQTIKPSRVIRFVKGNEWNMLTDNAMATFEQSAYKISNTSDRMGYRLIGNKLKIREHSSMISSAVTFGTIQLLPDGQLIVLMSDHQTTGGYPRIGHVITADLPFLAQKKPGEEIIFLAIELNIAEQELIKQQNYLQQLQTTCKFKMEKLLNVTL